VQADAQRQPLADRSFDLILSEYGLTGCDLYRWVAQAGRLLRPGAQLLVLGTTPLSSLCTPTGGPATDRLVRDYFGLHALHVIDQRTLEFQLPYGQWIRLLRDNGFQIEDLVEIQPPEDGRSSWPFIPLHWPTGGPPSRHGKRPDAADRPTTTPASPSRPASAAAA
jgi:hypothetical protein